MEIRPFPNSLNLIYLAPERGGIPVLTPTHTERSNLSPYISVNSHNKYAFMPLSMMALLLVAADLVEGSKNGMTGKRWLRGECQHCPPSNPAMPTELLRVTCPAAIHIPWLLYMSELTI